MAGREPDEATVDKLLLSVLDAYGRATQRMLPNGPSHLAMFSHEVRPILRAALAAIGPAQGRDAVIVERERCLIEAKNAVSIALDVLTDDDCVEAEWLHEQLDEHFRALASPEKVTAPLKRCTHTRKTLRGPCPTCGAKFDCDGQQIISAAPPAGSNLRKRAEKLIDAWGAMGGSPWVTYRERLVDIVAEALAAIRTEAKAEGCGMSPSLKLALEQMATLVERGALTTTEIPKWLRSLAEGPKPLAAHRPSPTGRETQDG